MSSVDRILAAAVAAAITTAPASSVDARRSRPRVTQQEPAAPSAETLARLNSRSAPEIERALIELAQIGGAPAARAIATRIERGLPAASVLPATETLGLLGDPAAGPVLMRVLLVHRRAPVRVAAIHALVATRPPGAGAAVRARLSDPEPRVRSTAAIALGELGDVGSTDALFRVLDRDLFEAAVPIAQLADAEGRLRLANYLGRLPFDLLNPAFHEILGREDVAEREKLDLIARIQDLGTPEARLFLTDLADSLQTDRDARALENAARNAAQRIPQ